MDWINSLNVIFLPQIFCLFLEWIKVIKYIRIVTWTRQCVLVYVKINWYEFRLFFVSIFNCCFGSAISFIANIYIYKVKNLSYSNDIFSCREFIDLLWLRMLNSVMVTRRQVRYVIYTLIQFYFYLFFIASENCAIYIVLNYLHKWFRRKWDVVVSFFLSLLLNRKKLLLKLTVLLILWHSHNHPINLLLRSCLYEVSRDFAFSFNHKLNLLIKWLISEIINGDKCIKVTNINKKKQYSWSH